MCGTGTSKGRGQHQPRISVDSTACGGSGPGLEARSSGAGGATSSAVRETVWVRRRSGLCQHRTASVAARESRCSAVRGAGPGERLCGPSKVSPSAGHRGWIRCPADWRARPPTVLSAGTHPIRARLDLGGRVRSPGRGHRRRRRRRRLPTGPDPVQERTWPPPLNSLDPSGPAGDGASTPLWRRRTARKLTGQPPLERGVSQIPRRGCVPNVEGRTHTSAQRQLGANS